MDFFGQVDLGFWHFPIFNVADIAITCGAILRGLSFWEEERREKARETPSREGAPSAPEAEGASAPAGSLDLVSPPGDETATGAPAESAASESRDAAV